ncbi:hypothetical protein N7450_006666 [Penicillium hetheringtonii]|uniref:Uncharacterized protein n=1 Tax=Penicillium hetheringtonii TaxID=911720 RepID=A0AAD6DFV8_9EURO|nr:hypothetical protein N7450_006666 [Penicillium hetheringtonii]
MHLKFSFLSRFTALALLAGPSIAMAFSQGTLKRNLKLAAELGIDPNSILRGGKSVHALVQATNGISVTPEYVELPIDHNDDSIGRYKNRYWVSSEYYQEGGPVFVYDVGEASAEISAKTHLTNDTSFFAELLSTFGGMGIVWEHRYYGDSLPFPVSTETPPEHFAYLTTKQALADIPSFAKNFTRSEYAHIDLTPTGTPWVMVGGSYAGIRAAFTRNEYPETIFASFASSAPVEARVDMSIYFDQVHDGMVANGHGNCTKDIKAALEYIDGELAKNATAKASIKQAFFGPGAEKNSDGDFTAALAGVYGYFQSYGLGGGDGSLENLCNHMETDPMTLTVAGPRGFAPYRGRKFAAEQFSSWPIFKKLVNVNYDTNCGQLDDTLPLSCVLNPKSVEPDTISWAWQFCTEWGFYQSNNFGPHSLLSRYQTLDYQQYTCNRQFPEGLKKGLVPKSPLVDVTNNMTGGWSIRPSNVYWSGGQFDPWRTLSPLATQKDAPQVALTTKIPKCNMGTDPETLFGYIMPNAEHCFDFQTDFDPGKVSRQHFYEALKEWLPCFKGQGSGVGSGNSSRIHGHS